MGVSYIERNEVVQIKANVYVYKCRHNYYYYKIIKVDRYAMRKFRITISDIYLNNANVLFGYSYEILITNSLSG